MTWKPEIDELNLTVRERIAALTDADTFQEIGELAGAATYEGKRDVTATFDLKDTKQTVRECG